MMIYVDVMHNAETHIINNIAKNTRISVSQFACSIFLYVGSWIAENIGTSASKGAISECQSCRLLPSVG